MKIHPLVFDFLAGFGISLLIWGVFSIYAPAGMIALGLALLLLGFWGAAIWVREKKVTKRRRE